MIPFDEVAVLDRNSEFRGVPPASLMENAGKGTAKVIEDRFTDRNVIFICGTGNNGGDGYVAARYLSDRLDKSTITAYLLKGAESVRTDIARQNLDRLECQVTEDLDWDDVEDEVVVDCLLGTGIKGDIREPYRSEIEKINSLDNPIVSIDIPSGLGADIQVKPDITVTFHDVKVGMKKDNCGEIIVKDIGIPSEAEMYTGPGELLLYPRPEDDSHKGDNGVLLIVGGGPYTGAPVLAGMGAYRAGVDLVHLAVPSEVSDIIAGYSPSSIVHPLEGSELTERHVEDVKKLADICDAALIGPGLGTKNGTKRAVRMIYDEVEIPMIIDADGLKALKDHDLKGKDKVVLTPHRGEYKILTGFQGDITDSADEFAQENEITLLLKGEDDFITDGERHKWNDFGTPAMSVGGTGDTLAGIAGALLAKGCSAFDAARLAAYINCRAGEIAFDDLRWGLLPEDISDRVPEVFNDIER